MEERLQKIMAHAGVASRRACEEMIVDGRVKVNGKVVTELGTRVDPDKDVVLLDGRPLTGSESLRYVVLYKPAGYLSDTESTDGRPCLVDLVKVAQRLYPVGRLDFDSEGLMLLTNDGSLAHRLTHPRYEHPKEYLVLVEGRPLPSALRKLRQGIELSEGKTAPAEVEVIDGPPPYLARPSDARPHPTAWLRMVLREGRKREIRHMTAVVGHPTLRLIRVGLGPLRLVHLNPGEWRDATLVELRHLRRVLQDKPAGRSVHPTASPARGQRSGAGRAHGAVGTRSSRPPRDGSADRPDRRDEPARGPRPDDSGRPPRRLEDDRPPRRAAGQRLAETSRPPSGRDAARPPRRDNSGRPPRPVESERSGRGAETSRPPSRGDAARPPRRDDSGRPPRPVESERSGRGAETSRPPSGRDAARPPRRDDSGRPPRRGAADRPPRHTDAGAAPERGGRSTFSRRPGASRRPPAAGGRPMRFRRRKSTS